MTVLRAKKDVLGGGPRIPDFMKVEPDEQEKKYQQARISETGIGELANVVPNLFPLTLLPACRPGQERSDQ